MDKEKVSKWLKVAKYLELNRTDILCPFCGNSILRIESVLRPDGKYDEHVNCPVCHERTVFGGVAK